MSVAEDNIKKVIGKGSFGEVYLVINNGCELARKDIKVNNSDVNNIRQEIDLLKKLRDRNVIIYKNDIYDVEKGIYHIYTEYFENGDLFCIIKKQRDNKIDFNERV